MNTRCIPARTAALLLLSLAAACRDDPTAVAATEPSRASAPASAPAVAVPAFIEIDLGSLGGGGTSSGINDSGHVVGWSVVAGLGNDWHAFLWTPEGGMQDLGLLPGHDPTSSSRGFDINDSGTVVGVSICSAFSRSSAGEWQNLGAYFNGVCSSANAINNKGEIVGSANGAAFLYRADLGMVTLETPSSSYTRAVDINDSSQILLISTDADSLAGWRFWIMRYPGEPEPIREVWENAVAINNAGQVVGTQLRQAFVWDSTGGLRYLPATERAFFSVANDINDAGWIVGHVVEPGWVVNAALWTPDGSGGYALTILKHSYSMARTINSAGEVAGSAQHPVLWTPVSPPAAPTNLAARAVSGGRVDLSWVDASSDETSFRVRRSTRQGGVFPPPYQTIATLGAGATAYSDTTVVIGETYAYLVQACPSIGGCGSSTPVTVDVPPPPAPPGGLTATIVSGREIALAWTNASTNESSFRVRRSTRGADGTFPPYQAIATLRRGSTSFADTTTAPGNVYRYQVHACNTSGCTASATVRADVPPPPAAPTGVTAGVVAGKGVEVWWTDASANETAFRVRRSIRRPDGTFAPFQLVGTVGPGVTAFTDGTAAGGGTYRYAVQACVDAVCASSTSAAVTVPAT